MAEEQKQEDLLLSVQPEHVVTEFKKKGNFDSLRKKLFSEFKSDNEDSFSQAIRKICQDFTLNDKSIDRLSTNDLTRKIMSYLDDRKVFYSHLRSVIDERIQSDEITNLVDDQLLQIIHDEHSASLQNLNNLKDVVGGDDQDVSNLQSTDVVDDNKDDFIEYLLQSGQQQRQQPDLVAYRYDISAAVSEEDLNMKNNEIVNDNIGIRKEPDTSVEEDQMQIDEVSESSKSESDSLSEEETVNDINLEGQNFTEVFLKGSKIAARLEDETYVVVIVKNFDNQTGLYACEYVDFESNQAEVFQIQLDNLLHFNHTSKSFKVGDNVYSLKKIQASSTNKTGLSSKFYKATVSQVNSNIIHVKFVNFDEKAIVKYNELFKIE